jgi:exonuclease VII large subunit
MERGYSITWREEGGALVRDPRGLQPGERLVTQLALGRVRSQVTSVEPSKEVADDR